MNRIRLTEAQLHRVIKESVNKIIMQEGFMDKMRGAFGGNNSWGGNSTLYDAAQRIKNDVECINDSIASLKKNDLESAIGCLDGPIKELTQVLQIIRNLANSESQLS